MASVEIEGSDNTWGKNIPPTLEVITTGNTKIIADETFPHALLRISSSSDDDPLGMLRADILPEYLQIWKRKVDMEEKIAQDAKNTIYFSPEE